MLSRVKIIIIKKKKKKKKKCDKGHATGEQS